MSRFERVTRWVHEGPERGATHVINVVDTFDGDVYPVWVMPGQDVQHAILNCNAPFEKVAEFYNMSMALDYQLAAPKAWNL